MQKQTYPKFEEFVSLFPEVKLDENQKVIVSERCRVLKNGEKEDWKQVAKRVALFVGNTPLNRKYDCAEAWSSDFFNIIHSLEFIPATPMLLNAASDSPQMFSCFASVVPDNMKKQYDLEYTAAVIFNTAAGLGMNFSYVRPNGYSVGKNGAKAYGVLKLMYQYHVNCDKITTGSIGRRGAQLAALDVYHPEIFDFVKCKANEKHYKTFNISVIVDKKFLDAVKNDEMITCRTWGNERPPRYKARRLFNKLVHYGWFNGEPGVLFLDNANENNPIEHYSKIESCNPCAEIPTVDWGSCNLGSINLVKILNEDNTINYEKYESIIRIATRFLDSVIDCSSYPDDKFKKMEEHLRSIGISMMGFADVLIKMKIPYGSDESLKLAEELSAFRFKIANNESEKLAIQRGIAPVFLVENGAPESSPKRRNAFLTTQAPCGSVSMIANCSPSIEPIFGLTMTKRCLDGKTFKYINADFEAFLKQKQIPEEHLTVIKNYVSEHGSIKSLPEFAKDDMLIEYWSPSEVEHFITAHDVNYESRLKMQAAFQKYTDQAISSTVNLPEIATEEDVATMIVKAHDLKLKGLCFFRNNSRKKQVLNVGDPNKNTWICNSCGSIHPLDADLDPTKVCIKCPSCGVPSCGNK